MQEPARDPLTACAASRPPGYFRTLAIDYDGTLAEADRPLPRSLAALDGLRRAGWHVVLVTGRVMSDLEAVFPSVHEHFDAVVAENGAVLDGRHHHRVLVTPVPRQLAEVLASSGVPVRRGEVLMSFEADDEHAVLGAVRSLGLECQLFQNRGHGMVLPAGISKASGLSEHLEAENLSRHNAVAIGDGENDHSLLDAVEVGVAVADAVPGLKERADIVLSQQGDDGLSRFLSGLLDSAPQTPSSRWRITLGTSADGFPLAIPASRINIALAGPPRRGKSFIAGLLVERLIALGYATAVLDPEGDHAGLTALRSVMLVGAHGAVPSSEALGDALHGHAGSTIIDLSHVDPGERPRIAESVLEVFEARRATLGTPQWIIADEAHVLFGEGGAGTRMLQAARAGYCFVTHRPEWLAESVRRQIDVLIVVPTGPAPREHAGLLAEIGGLAVADAERLLASVGAGQALLVERAAPERCCIFDVGERVTSHRRHEHKYAEGGLRDDRRFRFRSTGGTITGATAGNLDELADEITRCDAAAIDHHCHDGDFSRWVSDVLGDPFVGDRLRRIEQSATGAPESTRERLLALLKESDT